MKKAIWVLENINGSEDFYDELTIIMLVASICSWKKYNQTFNELHCDSMTFKKLESLDLLSLWDSVDTSIVDTDSTIDKQSFWASSKNRVLLSQDVCVSLVDIDLISYVNISDIGAEYPVVYSHDEDGLQWYPPADDEFINKMTSLPEWIIHTPNRSSLNVCYLSFNDLRLQKEYAQYSLRAMEELTMLKANNGAEMVWAEQKLLKQIIINKQLECKTLISNLFSCQGEKFHDDVFNYNGEWTFEESLKKYYHIGFDKKELREEGANLEFLYEICKESLDINSLKIMLKKKPSNI